MSVVRSLELCILLCMGNTPRNVLGGDPDLNALLFEAIDRVASPTARNDLIVRALKEAGAEGLPDDVMLLLQFVTGPLYATAEFALGTDAAGALVSDVQPILERVRKIRSSIPPTSGPPPDISSEAFGDAHDSVPPVSSAPTLPPKGLYRKAAVPTSAAHKRGTLPYAEVVVAQHHILVVDDDVIFLRGLTRLMRATGLNVLSAPDSGSAFRICERVRPALVISDLDMPAPNGLDLARQVRERMGENAPPFVLLTGTADPPAVTDDVKLVLTKSIRPEALLDAIAPFLPKSNDDDDD